MEILAGIVAALKAIPAVVSLIEMFIAAWDSYKDEQAESDFIENTKKRYALIQSYKGLTKQLKGDMSSADRLKIAKERREVFKKLYTAKFD